MKKDNKENIENLKNEWEWNIYDGFTLSSINNAINKSIDIEIDCIDRFSFGEESIDENDKKKEENKNKNYKGKTNILNEDEISKEKEILNKINEIVDGGFLKEIEKEKNKGKICGLFTKEDFDVTIPKHNNRLNDSFEKKFHNPLEDDFQEDFLNYEDEKKNEKNNQRNNIKITVKEENEKLNKDNVINENSENKKLNIPISNSHNTIEENEKEKEDSEKINSEIISIPKETNGSTKVTPDELEEKIIKDNEWIKDKYDKITHNSHSFVNIVMI